MSPSLTTIPPEIHGLIGSHLCIRDINSVSRTCKALKDAFLASLYENVVIRAPIQWSRLVSLENLISSASNGLKFTTGISIIAQQQPSKDNTQDNENDIPTLEDLAGSSCPSQASASKALNVMIRLLLRRIPDNHLICFNHRHSCSFEISTLALLFKHQSGTLREFSITRYPEPQDVSCLLVEGLRYLTITDLNIDQKCEWPSRLIIHNRNTLKHVNLGIVSTVAGCPIQDRPHYKLPTSLAQTAAGSSPPREPAMEILSLESLALSGLNLEDIVGGGALNFKIDFSVLTALRVESCFNLNKALTALVGNDNSTLSELKLTSFFLRHEEGSPAFAQNLTLFLTSFTGLQHLSLLIEGQRQAMSKGPILEMHGKTLRTLVWDERSGPRKSRSTDTALFLNKNGLTLVSQTCPQLYALGLCVRWGPSNSDESTTASPTNKYPQNIEIISRRLPKLRTLHLRNLPKIDSTASYLPIDYLVKGIASNIMDRYANGKPFNRQKSLITIALGAVLYRDVYIGSNHFPSDPVHNYLQLRVYHVDLNYQSVLGPSPTVTQVAKGFVDDVTMCSDKAILREYWLA